MTVANAGPNTANNRVITYTPPTGTAITALPAGCTGALPNGPLTCTTVATLANGATTSIIVPLTLSAGATPGATTGGGTASVTQDHATLNTDLGVVNNSTSVSVTAGAGSADLSVATSTPAIAPGGTGNATVTIANAGPSNAAGPITVSYTPPTGANMLRLAIMGLGMVLTGGVLSGSRRRRRR